MTLTNSTKLEDPLIPTEKDSNQPSPSQIRLFKDQIILNPTISKLNFAAYLLYSTYLGAIIVPSSLFFQPLLQYVYNLSYDQRADVTTIVQLVQLGVKLLICTWLGYLCDKYGRRIFVIIGVLLLCGSIAILPHLPSVYPYYIIVQVFYELGPLFLNTAPLLADYVDYETKGRVSGLNSVISYAASSVTTFLMAFVNVQNNIPSKMHEVAILGAVIGFLVVLGLKGGAYHKKLFHDLKAEEAKQHVPEILQQEAEIEEEEHQHQNKGSRVSRVKVRPESHQDNEALIENVQTQPVLVDRNRLGLNDSTQSLRENPADNQVQVEDSEEDFKPGFRAGIREAKKNPWVLTGYISGFLAYANVILVNTVLVNYCTQIIGSDDGPDQAYALTNKHMIVSGITAIFFGFFADKYNKFKILMFVVVSSFVAAILLLISPTMYNAMAYISMVLYGVVCSGFMTITNQLVSKYADPKYRASAFSVLSMSQNLGMGMTNILGVYLSQYNIALPYYIYLGCATVGMILLVMIYSKKKNILNNL